MIKRFFKILDTSLPKTIQRSNITELKTLRCSKHYNAQNITMLSACIRISRGTLKISAFPFIRFRLSQNSSPSSLHRSSDMWDLQPFCHMYLQEHFVSRVFNPETAIWRKADSAAKQLVFEKTAILSRNYSVVVVMLYV